MTERLTYSKMGLHDRAIADGTKAINLFEIKGNKKGLAFVCGNRGYLYQEKGSYERAVSDLNKSIELDPNFDHAYSQLAWVRATSPVAEFRNGRRAVELAEKALILDRDAHNLDSLSAAYAEVGRFEEAIDVQMLAIALVKTKADKSSLAKFEKHLDRYKSHKPWRTNVPEALPEITKLNEQANQQYRAQGRHAEAEPLYKRALAVREKARRREAARKRELRQKIEALSGRYATARGKSQWNISFQDNRFEARLWGSGTLLYDGTVTGIEISGLAYYYSTTLCRRSKTTPLRGHVDLLRKSIEIIMEDFDILERINNKNVSRSQNVGNGPKRIGNNHRQRTTGHGVTRPPRTFLDWLFLPNTRPAGSDVILYHTAHRADEAVSMSAAASEADIIRE